MQWLIDIIQEWIIEQGYMVSSFVNRGDPAAVDFNAGDFTQDFAWHELDLSGIIPANAKAVLIGITMINTATGRPLLFRSTGNSNVSNISSQYSQVAGINISCDMVIPINTAQKIDYLAHPAGWTSIEFIVKGWWL